MRLAKDEKAAKDSIKQDKATLTSSRKFLFLRTMLHLLANRKLSWEDAPRIYISGSSDDEKLLEKLLFKAPVPHQFGGDYNNKKDIFNLSFI